MANVGLMTILFVAALARLSWLTTVPPPLNQDEASPCYDAWSILETGADRHGQSWPIFRRNYGPGDYTGALGAYFAIPTVAILGPTVLAVRLPDALLGIATVWAMFALVRRWWGHWAGLAASAMLALDPWHIDLTRTGHEVGFAPFLMTTALLTWTWAGLLPSPATPMACRESPRTSMWWALIGGLFVGGLAWIYPSTRLFTPVFLVVAVCVGYRHVQGLWRERNTRSSLFAAVAGLIAGGAPLGWTALTHPHYLAARAPAALIFAQPWPLKAMLSAFVTAMAKNLDPRYLFWETEDLCGVMIPRVGQHLLVAAPFILIGGIRVLAAARRQAWARLIVVWFFLAIVPSAICHDWNPHPFRSIAGLPIYPILSALGLVWLVERVRRWQAGARNAAIAAATVALAINVVHFAHSYFWVFPPTAEIVYQTPLFKSMRIVAKHSAEADFVLVTNRANQPYIYALLCEPIPPRVFPTLPRLAVDGRLGFSHVARLGKYFFVPGDPARPDEAMARFRAEFDTIPPGSKGLIVDREGQFKDGERLAIVRCGDGRRTDENYEIRWWIRR